jgi:chloride channel 3/4/5
MRLDQKDSNLHLPVFDSPPPPPSYDELIRINGYPHLDNKAEFSLSEKAGDVMSGRGLCVLPMASHTIDSLDEVLRTTSFHGYPVVTTEEEMLVVGFIGRQVLQRVLDKARLNPRVTGATRCYFAVDASVPRDLAYIDLSPWLDQSPIQIVEITPLDRVIDIRNSLHHFIFSCVLLYLLVP